MLLYVINPQLDIIGMVEIAISTIWTNRYYEAGDFELYVPATDENIGLLVRDNYLVREGYETNAMIIENIQVSTDVENGNTMIITGRCLKSILSRRIIWTQTNLSGTISANIQTLLNQNIINPSDTKRKISNFIFQSNNVGTSNTLSIQFTGDNLLEAVVGICQRFGLGFDVTLDLDNKQFIFALYEGLDRSYDQDTNPYVVFSNDFENLLTTTYTENSTDYKNVAKVAGEGEGLARKSATAGDMTVTGLDRYELFIDSRNTSSNDGEITESEYLEMLQNEGDDELTNYQVIMTYEGDVETGKNYVLGTDYNLGDIVEVVNEYGLEATSRITEVIQAEDETGMHTIPTFSDYS